LVVNPDSSLEVAFPRLDPFGCNIEHVAMQFIHLLLADVKHIVFREFILTDGER
jgi:hypothetical protein